MEQQNFFTEEEKELMVKHHIFIPHSLIISEKQKLNNFTYKGKTSSCVYCGEPGITNIIHGLETSTLCDTCYYRECILDD